MIQNIDVAKLQPHPKNPRLIMREDVVAGIMAGLDNGFHESHALQVWPENEHFLIISGHHRFEAAKRKELTELPCWVRDDLDEDGAYMVLTTDNTQEGISPLEYGVHVLGCVSMGKRIRRNPD